MQGKVRVDSGASLGLWMGSLEYFQGVLPEYFHLLDVLRAPHCFNPRVYTRGSQSVIPGAETAAAAAGYLVSHVHFLVPP